MDLELGNCEENRAKKLLKPSVVEALKLLLEAYCYAEDVNQSVWDFAIEAVSFSPLGLNSNDFRWLICKGFIEHAREIGLEGEPRRTFRNYGDFKLTERTCIVLTKAGSDFVQAFDCATRVVRPHENGQHLNGDHSSLRRIQIRPFWDRDRQELLLNGTLVKSFKVPAPNQEVILSAFQEEKWPPRIDDPLPPHPDQDPKRRLHDTINSLNRNQKHPLLRFMGDGSGQGVRWECL